MRDSGGDGPVLSVRVEALDLAGAPILSRLAFDLAAGETAALVGPSGIGKTTLLRCVAGLERRYRGRIDAPRATSMIFQEPLLLPWRTARENLTIPARLDAEGAEAALASVGLRAKGDLVPGQLSLGQQRRLSLARAFATRPRLMLMDEPFVSLDAALADEMMDLFARLRDETGVTTLLVSHVEAEAERLASRVITLGDRPARILSDRRQGA